MENFDKASKLKNEANSVLKSLDLLEVLRGTGEVKVIGSLALDLMVYRDIDLEVIVKELSRATIQKVVEKLINQNSRRVDFSVIDNSEDQREKFPRGIYLGIKCHLGMEWMENFSKSELTWKIDIWFVEPRDARSWLRTKEVEEQLTEESKKTILDIKNVLYKHPRYRKDFSANDIYEAVLNHGVKHVEDFNKFLDSH